MRVFSASQLPSSSYPFPYEHHLFVAARCVPDVISRLVLYHNSSRSPKRVWPGVVVDRRRDPKCAKANLRYPGSHGPRFRASSGLTSRLRCGMSQQPGHRRNHGQACPVPPINTIRRAERLGGGIDVRRSYSGAGPQLWLMTSPSHAVGEAAPSAVDPGELTQEAPSGAPCGRTYCSHTAPAWTLPFPARLGAACTPLRPGSLPGPYASASSSFPRHVLPSYTASRDRRSMSMPPVAAARQ